LVNNTSTEMIYSDSLKNGLENFYLQIGGNKIEIITKSICEDFYITIVFL
jgi:hypothetical protein